MYRIGQEEINAVTKVLLDGHIWRHKENSESIKFESEFSAKIGSKYTVALTSGTGSLMSALNALGIGPGDEVIVPAYTFIATAVAPLAVGAVPILAEVDETLTISPEDVEKKITKNTKAIIPVHINGHPCNMDKIMEIADKHNLYVVEDACQATGGAYHDKKLGTIGNAGAYSFNYFKTITAGEGGAVVTNDPELYEKVKIYHDCGLNFFSPKQIVSVPFFAGFNFRISDLLSAVLREQLKKLDGILFDLRTRKKIISEALINGNGYRLSPMNDVDGDCGIKLGIYFNNHEHVKKVINALDSLGFKLKTECPYDTDKHVYTNWEAILNQRGANNRKLNPYTSNPVQYSKDMCPNTLIHLKHTLYIIMDPNMSLDETYSMAKMLSQAINMEVNR